MAWAKDDTGKECAAFSYDAHDYKRRWPRRPSCPMMTALQLVLLLLGASVLSIALCRKMALPPILGYLLVGALIGPHALRLFPAEANTFALAEFGVVFLMFTIGLEFSLPNLIAIRRIVFGLGLAQVALCIGTAMLVNQFLGGSWMGGVALGGILAMSSTAILSKLLAERVELDSPHGREVMGVLLFQDLAVVPLLILLPALSTDIETLAPRLLTDMLKAAAMLGLVFFVGQRGIGRWMSVVARRKSSELFMLNVLLVTLGLAELTHEAGLSSALGAFVAGMLISETEYRYQVEEDIKPFRDLLLGLFFISIGMLLNYRVILHAWHWVLGLLAVMVFVKLLIAAGLSRLFGATNSGALRTGLWLCTGGEFGFVLLSETAQGKILSLPLQQTVLAALVLSLFIAPIIVHFSDRIVMRLVPSEWLMRALQLTDVAARSVNTEKHAIICGYGRTGQYIGEFFDAEGIAWMALDKDADRVIAAANAGKPVVFGDDTRPEILMAAGLARANVVVITFSGTDAALRVLSAIRSVRNDVPVVSRAQEQDDTARLLAHGATEVVPEALESSLMLATHALAFLGLPLHRVIRSQREAREARYDLLRGFLHGASDVTAHMQEAELPRLHTVTLHADAPAVGKMLRELDLESLGVRISAVRRRQSPALTPSPDLKLLAGDALILLGLPQYLIAAEQLLAVPTP